MVNLCIAIVVSHTNKRELIVDSGASKHITNDLDNFVDFEDIDPVSVHLPNAIVFLARKNGSVCKDLSLLRYIE